MPHPLYRCQIVPLPNHRVSFVVDGQERLGWHFGTAYPRPFFFPVNGPSGNCLTRLGHPGAPNHDHHQSVWFAHHKVLGIDFWGNTSPATIRQKEWLAYQEGDIEAVMAVRLAWFDGHDPKELLEQELVVGVRPGRDGETLIELQSTFRPTGDSLEFGKTNFGFLAVRVARSLSAHFGGGQLTDSEGRLGEPAIFGQSARWMDYSGPIARAADGTPIVEGITYFDHPSNPGHPAHWHVREDGWMGASACFSGPVPTTKAAPLVLRYLLRIHGGAAAPADLNATFDEFSSRSAFVIRKSTAKHEMWTVTRS